MPIWLPSYGSKSHEHIKNTLEGKHFVGHSWQVTVDAKHRHVCNTEPKGFKDNMNVSLSSSQNNMMQKNMFQIIIVLSQ